MKWFKRLFAWHPAIVDLQDNDYSIRFESIRALSRTADPRAARALIKALHRPLMGKDYAVDSDGYSDLYSEVDMGECDALVRLGEIAVEPLVAAIRTSDSRYALQECIAALGRIGGSRVIDFLLSLYRNDKEGNVGLAVLKALGNFPNDSRVYETLLDAKKTPGRWGFLEAANSLSKIRWMRYKTQAPGDARRPRSP